MQSGRMVDVPEEARIMLGLMAARRPDDTYDPSFLWTRFGGQAEPFVDAVDDLWRHGYIQPQDVVLPDQGDGRHGATRHWIRPGPPRHFRRMGISRPGPAAPNPRVVQPLLQAGPDATTEEE